MTQSVSDLQEAAKASRDHHVQELVKLNDLMRVHKAEIAKLDKILGAGKPKRVISDDTRKKMRDAHALRKATGLTKEQRANRPFVP